MTNPPINEEEKAELEGIEKSTLPESALRAVMYFAVVYVILQIFPSATWLWFVLGAYLIFDIACVMVVKVMTYIVKKRNNML
ncbi:Uncharacterised protein [BD1-7 clade bacterium]|uniref:Uncharacterized protein n=1 Tax=BD1-7 clade bacterium TaxID=2029982 RepID=A0A5S9NQJ5_9GAMM|nr:Uncharacterised protein [BD1-7 clade bacterium]